MSHLKKSWFSWLYTLSRLLLIFLDYEVIKESDKIPLYDLRCLFYDLKLSAASAVIQTP